MTPAQVKAYVLKKLHLDSIDEFYENHTDMETVANLVLDDLYCAISWKNIGYFGDYKALDLTGSLRIYHIDDAILNKIISIEAKLGGSGSYSWKPVVIKGKNKYPNFIFEESWITNNFSNDNPHGFIHGGNLYLLSGTVSAETSGLRIWFLDFPDKISSMDSTTELAVIKTVNTPEGGTTAIGLPRQFHRLFANGIIIDYKEANELPLVGKEVKFDLELKNKLDELSPLVTSEEIKANIPEDDGSKY